MCEKSPNAMAFWKPALWHLPKVMKLLSIYFLRAKIFGRIRKASLGIYLKIYYQRDHDGPNFLGKCVLFVSFNSRQEELPSQLFHRNAAGGKGWKDGSEGYISLPGFNQTSESMPSHCMVGHADFVCFCISPFPTRPMEPGLPKGGKDNTLWDGRWKGRWRR